MISKELVLSLNKIIAESSGGSSGIRDEKSLLSAINRPFQTFDGKDLYPSAIDKSAAIFQSIIINHPFIDGNKRMAYAFLRLLLFEDGLDIDATDDEKYQFVIEASKGKLDFDQIKSWIISNLKK
ncbi:MAG: type II toxin-antitoxin system death-on-curing family toxin [Cellulophaga sp.]|nr:type II toxin-antitoxin system death-on-curing family toxin [Cellulophaga sp.]